MGSDRVLIIDDDPAVRALIRAALQARDYEVLDGESCADARRLGKGFEGVVLLDVQLPDGLGPEVIPELRKLAPTAPVVVLTGHGSTDLALSALRAGASDFLSKDQVASRLLDVVRVAFVEREALSCTATSPARFPTVLTRAASMRTLLHELDATIDSGVPVLIRGESGTGKEVLARALHDAGPRAGGPFVAVNCAGIPDNLLEAELFGYERGAFTGAAQRKLGRFDLAQGGTLLLDEIGEMQPLLQAKLLRVIQEKEYQRLGGVETLRADVRILSATHRELERDVEEKRFREDLYYRLAVFTVEIPPLRDREGDIALLAQHFLERAARRERKHLRGFDPMALRLLESYGFPGNVRQLENVVSHAVVVARGRELGVADLPQSFLTALELERVATEPEAEETEALVPSPAEGVLTLAEVERRHILSVLEGADGNKTRAAKLLGVSRMTLYRKIEEYGLT